MPLPMLGHNPQIGLCGSNHGMLLKEVHIGASIVEMTRQPM